MADLWQEIASTVASEFSDVPDAAQATRIVVRLAMAALLGGLLGWEREHAGKAAGVRTHMLVAMGAALFVLVAQQAGIEAADNSRVLQGIIAGVGFLGAGTILKGDAESQVKGLTTAAGIWLTAAIGVASGLGREAYATLVRGKDEKIIAVPAPKLTQRYDRINNYTDLPEIMPQAGR